MFCLIRVRKAAAIGFVSAMLAASTGSGQETSVPAQGRDTIDVPLSERQRVLTLYQQGQEPRGEGQAISVPPEGRTLRINVFQDIVQQTQTAATGGNGGTTNPYLDNAVPLSRLTARYDLGDNANRPDRAEFFYPQNGPTRIRQQPVSFQQYWTNLEYAPWANFSGFLEVPVRFLRVPPPRADGRPGGQWFSGFSDMRLGAKYAFIAEPDRFYTFQLRTYLPTGTGAKGLGTTHASIEPGLLMFRQLSERLYFAGELEDWIPLHGSMVVRDPKAVGNHNAFVGRHYAGSVLTYAVSLTYNWLVGDHYRFAPSTQVVGWTVLGGLKEVGTKEVPAGGLQSASGDTIVNYKIGVTYALGNYCQNNQATPLNDRLSLYMGYSRALTGDWWYKDGFRVELNWYF